MHFLCALFLSWMLERSWSEFIYCIIQFIILYSRWKVTIKKCLETHCSEPYNGNHGKHLHFHKEKGLRIGESGFFRCDDHYSMPPLDDSKFHRKEVRIFCQRVYDSLAGISVQYRLETGIKVPQCVLKGNNIKQISIS